ncbi:MAG TPA: hypothetical protein DCP53_05705 [Elusimicrobia bacterium]|nr:hypothetical protein [Elusimicrobiota bacterium]
MLSNIILYIKIGTRNLFKYKRRSLQIIIIILIGAFVITAIGGFTTGFIDNYMKDIVENTSHGKIYFKGFYQKQEISPLELSIVNYKEIIEEIKNKDNTTILSPSISAGIVLSSNENSTNIMCQGISPFSDKKEIFPTYKVYHSAVVQGRFFENNNDTGILIGSYTASNLKCKINDKVILFTSDSYGSFNAVELKIIGIYKTGYIDKDEDICLIDLSSMQKLVGLENRVTEISLFFNDINKADTFKNSNIDLIQKYNLEYLSWKDLLGSLIYAIDIGNKFNLIIYIIFIVVAAVGIMNTILISIFDRMRDIGTLRSIGFTKNNVTHMLITELFILGFIGSVLGVIMGGYLIYYFSIHGIPISDSAREMAASFFSGNRIYPGFNLKILIYPLIISCIVPLLSSIYPIIIMRKLKIKEALGYL